MRGGIVVVVDGNGTVELRVVAGSAEVRRELGVAAWSVLEVLALGGAADHAGRWMTYSNARDLAQSLGIGKDRVGCRAGRPAPSRPHRRARRARSAIRPLRGQPVRDPRPRVARRGHGASRDD